jgi:hypothetical protein
MIGVVQMTDAKETIICISANGKTTSSSTLAARRMLVATAEGVLDFRRDGPGTPWHLQDDVLLAGQHVSALVFDEKSGLLFAALHFEGGLQVSVDGGKPGKRATAGCNRAMPIRCWCSMSATRSSSISAPNR